MGSQAISSGNVQIWRLNLKPSSQKSVDVFDFCRDRNLVGFGWLLSRKPNSIEECIQLGQKEYSDKGFNRAIAAMKNIKENDLIWTRKGGVYYISRVKSTWRYDDTEEYRNADIINYIYVHDFIKIGTVDEIPGKVQRSFIPSATLQRVYDISNITTALYNYKSGTDIYLTQNVCREDLLNILSPEDIEEIVCLYLQVEEHYKLYSSTCKKSTELYECVMVKEDGSHKCYPQVKTGRNDLLDGKDYIHLIEGGMNYVYLFSTSQNYKKVEDYENIIYLKPDTILAFMESHKEMLPERVRAWFQYIKT